ncbi:AlbA family DNA-binding domain-containing protein [Sphingobacterium corticibacter]|uniref:Schlafen AlbA-2 domain-containing protein n=1 Tax=Sphingobacterium corticibacter TaxID=2171749 RepID=A0A2T8HHC2_9SPHI|nr:ATP-binding protein [Sphingobacterium corticibacter]PVH24722.1 hypothetical protein DC487_11350 [Sphingobacterium corticibacter]
MPNLPNFFEKDDYNIDDIKLLIQQEAEESINIDFKSSGSLDKSDNKKKEIGKDISSFANSDGGIIVYGLSEKDHKASEIDFVEGNVYTKEWLEQVISSKISPRINNLKIYPIRFEGDISKSVYIVKIPKSNSVHMNTDKKYYRRYNFESVAMEEYEVSNLYSRVNATELDLEELEVRTKNSVKTAQKLTSTRVVLRIAIRNTSRSLEKDYKLEVQVPKTFFRNVIGMTQGDQHKVNSENGMDIYSIPNKSTLFPGEKDYLFTIEFPVNRIDEGIFNESLTAILYYTNGTKVKEFNLRSTFDTLGWNT